MGDHTESIQIDYDPSKTTYKELLNLFWSCHSPHYRSSTQYMSAIFFSDPQQEKEATESKKEMTINKEVFTKILPLDSWTNAEDYHQKYYLRGAGDVMDLLGCKSDDELRDNHIATRINGYVDGKGKSSDFEKELASWNFPEEAKKKIREKVLRFR